MNRHISIPFASLTKETGKLELQLKMDVDRFIRSKNWQTEFNSLNKNELVIASIFTILTCPNYTCRKEILFQRVIHLLKVRTSRGPKEEFKESFNRALQRMINPMKIFKEYNVGQPHPRIKFIKNESSLDALDSCLKKYYKDLERKKGIQLKLNQQDNRQKTIPLIFANSNDKKIDEIEEEIQDGEEDDKDINLISGSDSENQSWDSKDELDILGNYITEDWPDIDSPATNLQPDQSISLRNSLNFENLKTTIVSHFESVANFTVEDEYPELKISYIQKRYGMFLLLRIDKLEQELIIKSFVELEEREAADLLRIWNSISKNSAICIERYRIQEYYVVRQYVDLKRYAIEEVVPIIDDVIRTAKAISDTLYEYR